MDFQFTEEQEEIKKQVPALFSRFPDEYWRERDETGEFPWDFYQAFADGGWLGITIPREYGGSGLGVTETAPGMQTVGGGGGGAQGGFFNPFGVFRVRPPVKKRTEKNPRQKPPQEPRGVK